MTDTVVVEGHVKFREGKKWKSRWVVLRKPSPVADCLSLLVYKEKKKKGKERGCSHKERLNVTLEGICGVEPATGYEGIPYTLTILCSAHTLVLGFNNRDTLLAWDARVRYSLGEVHWFSVNVEPGTKLQSGPASLHLCNNVLILTRGLPPVIIGHWKLSALRRYGAVPKGFVFEGGTRCGSWSGVFFLACAEGERISFLFDCIVSGVAPSRAPHGVRPSLPADPGADPGSAEERISQEASELEKRLSMLSQCSLASSTASTYSFTTSSAGDDHSSISSSSSSQSDTSYGRLPFWGEPLARLHLSNETTSSSSMLKALTGSDDRLYSDVMRGAGTRPSSAHLHPRGLLGSGRQSSLDSGIGITAGSQSSYSGSCSSCTGSLETASQGGGEDNDSVTSQPRQPTVTSEHNCCSSSCATISRSSSCASYRQSETYQIPNLLTPYYDTPRSFLQTSDSRSSGDDGSNSRLSSSNTAAVRAQLQAVLQQRSHSMVRDGQSTLRPQRGHGDLLLEETQSDQDFHSNYITPEQWRSARESCLTQVSSLTSSDVPHCAETQGLFPSSLNSAPSVSSDDGPHVDSAANYINIPSFIAKTTRDFLHRALNIQEPGSCQTFSLNQTVLEEGSAHCNITALKTAHTVEHVPEATDRQTQLEDKASLSFQTECGVQSGEAVKDCLHDSHPDQLP